MHTRPQTVLVFCCALIASSIHSPAAAEDVVYLRGSSDGAAPAPLRGDVLDYTGRELRIDVGGRSRTIPATQVERVETSRSPEHESADRLFAEGDSRAAASRYQAALQTTRESRDWVRRELLASLIWCERNLEQWDQAGEHFLILLAGDPATRHFAALPLLWTDEAPSVEIQRKAQAWLTAPEPAAALMGASILLTSSHRDAAIDTLKRLLRDDDSRIAWLAYSQLWRPGAASATEQQRHTLTRRIEESDPELRAGAYFVLARSYAADDPEQAALAAMRIPLVYEREYLLAAASLVEAGDCLERLERPDHAAALYLEVLSRFPHARQPIAAAQHRLRRLGVPIAAGNN